MRLGVAVILLVWACGAVAAPAPDSVACLPGIAAAERRFALPPQLLGTIGIVESGRPDAITGRVSPWPWTINVGGIGHFFASKAEAIEEVEVLLADGIRSIDVGCMQINLLRHPDAFVSLDDAFDPPRNTEYGARFLSALFREMGNWPDAAAAYHSRTQEIGGAYVSRVMALWPLAAQYRASPPPPEAQPQRDTIQFTAAFAAHLKQSRADLARLAAGAEPVVRPAAHPAAAPRQRLLARNTE